jgi:hypothetical protein
VLQAQSKFPSLFFYGTNFGGFSKKQADGSSKNFMEAAKHFGVDIMCYEDGRPILPEVRMSPDVGRDDFVFPFHSEFFDLIVSRDALNHGKIKAAWAGNVIPRFLPLMKPEGGVAMLHLHWTETGFWTEKTQFTDVLSVYNIPLSQAEGHVQVSVVIFKIQEKFVTVGIKKCDPKVPIVSPYGDCVIPATYTNPHRPSLMTSFVPMIPKDNAYGKVTDEYMKSVYINLNIWNQRKYIMS